MKSYYMNKLAERDLTLEDYGSHKAYRETREFTDIFDELNPLEKYIDDLWEYIRLKEPEEYYFNFFFSKWSLCHLYYCADLFSIMNHYWIQIHSLTSDQQHYLQSQDKAFSNIIDWDDKYDKFFQFYRDNYKELDWYRFKDFCDVVWFANEYNWWIRHAFWDKFFD